MAIKSPLNVVKEKFGAKDKLVSEVEKFASDDLWVARTNKNKGLAHVSNAKLLRLHATFTEVKAKFGTRAKLIDAIVEIEKRAKDPGYRKGLEAYPVPRLYDLYKSASKRTSAATKAAAPKSPKASAPKKAAAAATGKTAGKTAVKTAPAKASVPPKKAAAKGKSSKKG